MVARCCSRPYNDFIAIMDYIIMVLIATDSALTFFVAKFKLEQLVTDYHELAMDYLR